MTFTVFLAVLLAAALHAGWNALVKGSSDKYLNMAAVVLGHAPFALVMILISPVPAVGSWPYLLCGLGLHFGYQLFLLNSYKIGDLTQVYPIARGIAPLLVAGISVLLLGVHLQGVQVLAIALIATGIMSLALVRQADGTRNGPAALLAVITGGFIAGYSLVDGTGARIAGTALGFYGWLALGNAAVFMLFTLWTRPGMMTAVMTRGRRTFVIGGGASFAAYAIVTWAFTQAPIALVTALRETSIVFALLIGVFVLKERLDLAKVLSTFITLCGAGLLKFAR